MDDRSIPLYGRSRLENNRATPTRRSLCPAGTGTPNTRGAEDEALTQRPGRDHDFSPAGRPSASARGLFRMTKLTISKRALGMAAITGALVAAPLGLATGTASAAGHNWDAVAQCESGGNWGTNTGNGFYGGLQFTQSTWASHGGSGSPQHASKAEQIRVAENVLANQGPGAWPVCGKHL